MTGEDLVSVNRGQFGFQGWNPCGRVGVLGSAGYATSTQFDAGGIRSTSPQLRKVYEQKALSLQIRQPESGGGR